MADACFVHIIELCLEIDRIAADIYTMLNREEADSRLKPYWADMARDENEHVLFWERLLAEVRDNEVPDIFDDPQAMRETLVQLKEDVAALRSTPVSPSDPAVSFMLAYKLEFYLLHPAFAALFRLMRRHTGDSSPEDKYEEHIDRLIQALKAIGADTPVFSLFADIIHRVWVTNNELAKKIGEIKTLRNLIPMCTNCKKVINCKGYWETMTYYLRKHPDSSFTHWLCPDCLEKLYPEQSARIKGRFRP